MKTKVKNQQCVDADVFGCNFRKAVGKIVQTTCENFNICLSMFPSRSYEHRKGIGKHILN